MPFEPTGGAHPSVVLSAYIEPLVRGRRVAVLGDARLELGPRLLERGARLVHAYDPEPARVAEALSRSPRSGSVTFAVLEAELGVRDGAFDVVVIPDLSQFADPAEIVRRARRLASANGTTVVASPNAGATRTLVRHEEGARTPLGYYELFDLVSLQFGVVRMVGQAPFVGYTIADFAPDGEPSVTVDTSLLAESEEPEWFLAIAGERPVDVEPYAVIGLPIAGFADALREDAVSADANRAGLDEAHARIATLAGEVEKLREQRHQKAQDLEARETNAAAMAARLVELEKDLDGKTAHARDLEARAGDAHVRAERLVHDLRASEEELARQRDRATRLSKQLDDERRARTKADVELGIIRAKPPEVLGAKDRIDVLTAELDAAQIRIAELENPITDRPRTVPPESSVVEPDPALLARIAELEANLRAAERRVKDLTHERDAAAVRAEASKASRAAMERELTDREAAHLIAIAQQRARIEELEQSSAEASAPDVAALEEALRERGAVVTQLRLDLRESERIGRELVAELEEARAAGGSAASPPPGSPETASSGTTNTVNGVPSFAPAESAGHLSAMPSRLDALASKAAKAEADVHASMWRIAELERRIADAEAEREAPSATRLELEQALTAAQQQIAELRRPTLAAPRAREEEPADAVVAPHHGADLESAVMEQSVLLEQVAGSQDPATPR